MFPEGGRRGLRVEEALGALGSCTREWLRAHGTWLASRLILAEDVRMLVRSQVDMDVDVVPQHLLHDFEAASAHFHATIDRWMTR